MFAACIYPPSSVAGATSEEMLEQASEDASLGSTGTVFTPVNLVPCSISNPPCHHYTTQRYQRGQQHDLDSFSTTDIDTRHYFCYRAYLRSFL